MLTRADSWAKVEEQALDGTCWRCEPVTLCRRPIRLGHPFVRAAIAGQYGHVIILHHTPYVTLIIHRVMLYYWHWRAEGKAPDVLHNGPLDLMSRPPGPVITCVVRTGWASGRPPSSVIYQRPVSHLLLLLERSCSTR